MDCQIPGGNMIVLHKAISCLAKICEEVYIESHAEHLTFVTIHHQKTTYAKFTFRSVFFLNYESKQCDSNFPNTCKVNIKSLLNVFKQRMEKKIELCRMTLDKDATKIVIKLKYKDDVNLVHSVNLIDFDMVNFRYDVEMPQSVVGCSAQFFNQILTNFQAADEDVSLEVYKDKTIIRNYNTDLEHEHNGIRSQIIVTSREFQSYQVDEETNIVIGLKPMRAALGFAEHFDLNIKYYFKCAGWPFTILMKSSTFELDMVLATGNAEDNCDDCSTCSRSRTSADSGAVSSCSHHAQVSKLSGVDKENEFLGSCNKIPFLQTQKNGLTRKTSIESRKTSRTSIADINALDKLAMASVNWEDDEDFGQNSTTSYRSEAGSPDVKKARIFGRCFDPTFHASMIDLGDDLAANSDSDEEEIPTKLIK